MIQTLTRQHSRNGFVCAGGDAYVAATFTVGRLCAQKGELAKCATGVRASAAFIAREVVTHFLIGPFAD
jgi:hypothetical protein